MVGVIGGSRSSLFWRWPWTQLAPSSAAFLGITTQGQRPERIEVARIRTIKPEFAHSESMGRISRDARLTFVLLWTIADDSGRLRGNSRMLASLLFPYDDDAKDNILIWLLELQQEGCIVQYEHEGNHYLQICNWLNHQRIDKPSPSKIPEFQESSRILHEASQTIHAGMEGKGPGPGKDQEGNISNTTYSHPKPSVVGESCPYQKIVELYHSILPNHPRVRELTAKRRTHIKARWSNGMEKSLSEFEGYFNAVQRSKFLTGKVDPPPGRKRFIADFDFLMSERGYIGILEGKYE